MTMEVQWDEPAVRIKLKYRRRLLMVCANPLDNWQVEGGDRRSLRTRAYEILDCGGAAKPLYAVYVKPKGFDQPYYGYDE